ncbi:hypothetical protein HKD37_04G010261 [Glycine soja]
MTFTFSFLTFTLTISTFPLQSCVLHLKVVACIKARHVWHESQDTLSRSSAHTPSSSMPPPLLPSTATTTGSASSSTSSSWPSPSGHGSSPPQPSLRHCEFWRLLSLFLSLFRYHSSSEKQRNRLMKKILGLQAPMELTSRGPENHSRTIFTLGYGVLRSSKNLGELASDDYPAFGTLIWREKLTSLTLLLLTGSETVLFGVGSLGSIYIILVYGDHSQLSSMWLCKNTNT